jgi:arylsulfatase A-like enzyme
VDKLRLEESPGSSKSLILARFTGPVKSATARGESSKAVQEGGQFNAWHNQYEAAGINLMVTVADSLPSRNQPLPFRLIFMLKRILLLLCAVLIPVFSHAGSSPNIILITLDSARSDRFGFMGGKRPTPNLDALARQGILFERAYAQAPTTVVSGATILSGTYPQTHQVNELGAPLGNSLPYLPASLRARGYHTAAVVGAIDLDPKAGFAPGFDRGFESYVGAHPPRGAEGVYRIAGRAGAQEVASALRWLAQNPHGPFFLWLHIYIPGGGPAASYDSSALADVAVAQLMAQLRTRKLYDDTAIVLTGTHGEGLGVHDEDLHGVFLYDETIHVPLVLKLPQNQLAGKHVPARVRLLDVAPTILEIAGVAVPSQMEGQSLLRIAKTNPTTDQPVYSRTDFPNWAFGWSPLESWRAGKYLYVRAPKPELYDLTADPGATHNLASSSKATLDTLAGQLDAFSQHFKAGGKSSSPGLSSSEMQKLASLGYVGIQKSSGSSTAVSGTDPKDGIAAANKIQGALAQVQSGDASKVVSTLQAQAAAQSGSYLAQYGLGVAYASTRQYPKAVEVLHKAIELQPNSPWAHFYMGTSLLQTGDFKTAAVHLEIASARLPEFREAHTSLAEAYDHLGRTADAKKERARAGK